MECQLPMPEGTDPEGFPHHEDFYTSLIACAILKARAQIGVFNKLPIWWTENEKSHVDWSELVAPDFRLHVLQNWQGAGVAPDIRIESSKALVLVETKVDAEFEERQMGPVFRYLSRLGDKRNRAYLLMAPGAYGGPKFHPGTLAKFYKAAEGGVRAGFVNLALATNCACELLGLQQLS